MLVLFLRARSSWSPAFFGRRVCATRQLCDDVRNGCKHVLASAQNKLIMKTVSFTVPAPDFAKDNLFAEFSAELSLMV